MIVLSGGKNPLLQTDVTLGQCAKKKLAFNFNAQPLKRKIQKKLINVDNFGSRDATSPTRTKKYDLFYLAKS